MSNADLLKKASDTIRQQADVIKDDMQKIASLTSEVKRLTKSLQEHERRQECYKIAELMVEKGIIDSSGFKTQADTLFNSKENVEVMRKAAEYMVPGSSIRSEMSVVDNDIPTGNADEVARHRFSTMT